MTGILKKPDWIKIRYKTNSTLEKIRQDVRAKGIATVCQESLCPNISECWTSGTATFMLMGDTCTRSCRFCHVKKSLNPKPLDPEEPIKLLDSIKKLKLNYVVLTSVDRDDLHDQGARHLSKTIKYLKKEMPELLVEILIPDFQGKKNLIRLIVNAKPEVIAHNVETVERLTPSVRDRRASYYQSLLVLRSIKQMSNILTKSSIMVGLGETEAEVEKTMDDLKRAGVSFLTIGQYLQPTKKQLPVFNYESLETFKYYEELAHRKGFINVVSGPFVRSSYKAGELYQKRG